MFIKTTKSGKYEYAYLVRSYREGNKTKHEYLFNLGRLDQIENNPSYQQLALRLLKLSKAKNVVNLNDISQAKMVNWGYTVYQKIWKQFELDRMLEQVIETGKTQFNLNDAAFLMTIQHLLEPKSKLSTHAKQNRYVKLPEVELHHLYRSLDLLSNHKEFLEDQLFVKNYNLFNMKVDVVFYDVTTFSFESVKADSLRDFGFSKDCKFKEVQVVLGLLVDCEGRPIGYELFPGNTFESKTLEAALDKLEKRFGLRNVIIVADRGINSKINLKRIKDKGYDYIVATRLKKAKKEVQEELFNRSGYREVSDEEKTFRYKVIDYTNIVQEDGKKYFLEENLILTYSSTRAERDRSDRERMLEKAKSLLDNKSKIKAQSKRGVNKYLKEVSKGKRDYTLDEQAIAKDERFDGYYGLQTSEKDLDAYKVLEAYHTLWKIEESFRIMKNTLEVRPVFHWTEERIKGHFVVCFLSFLLERTLELKLNSAGETASPEKIREALNSLNFAKLVIDEEGYYVKTQAEKLGNKIVRLMRMKSPKNVTPLKELKL